MRIIDRLVALARQVLPTLPPELLSEVSAEDQTTGGLVLSPRDEVLQTHGGGDFTTYERLLDDDQVRPCFRQRRTEVIAREWQIDPGGSSELDQLAADDLRAQMIRIGWDRTCFKMLSGLMYGFNVGECMFGVDESSGRVQLRSLLVRRPARFCFSSADRSLMLKKLGRPVALPAQKFWAFSCGAENDDDPYGSGLGAPLYWPVWFKRNGLKFWAIFLERFASPTPKATVPPGTTEADRDKLLELLGRVMNGGRIVVPRGVDVELIQALRSSGGDFDQFCARMDRAIAKIILLQTMTTEDGSSRAQAEVHQDILTASAKTDSDLLDESFGAGPATWLTQWNYPGAKTPRIYRDFAQAVDLKAAADRDMTLSQMGWQPTEKYIRETYGDNYERAPISPKATGLTFGEPPLVTSQNPFATPDGWVRVMGPEVARIEALLGKCHTLTDVRERLSELALEDPEQLTELLARMMFSSSALGQSGGELD